MAQRCAAHAKIINRDFYAPAGECCQLRPCMRKDRKIGLFGDFNNQAAGKIGAARQAHFGIAKPVGMGERARRDIDGEMQGLIGLERIDRQ